MARMRVQETVRTGRYRPGNGEAAGAYTGHKLALSSSPPLRAGSAPYGARRAPGHTTEPPFVLYVPQRASETGERCAERVVLVLSHLNRPNDQSGITSPPAGRCGTENHSHGRTLAGNWG